MSLEDIPMRSEAEAMRSKAVTRPKEQREKKSLEMDTSSLGLKIYAAAANRFRELITYEEIVDGAKNGKYKLHTQ